MKEENEITQHDIDEYSRANNLIIVDWLVGALSIIVTALFAFDLIGLLLFTLIEGGILTMWYLCGKMAGPKGQHPGPVDAIIEAKPMTMKTAAELPHNQGAVLRRFVLFLCLYIGCTSYLTYLFLFEILEIKNYAASLIMITVGICGNIFLAVQWISNSFDFSASGKKIAQLKMNGNLLLIGRNLRPSKLFGFCLMLPSKSGWFKIEITVNDEELKPIKQVITGDEDGEQYNVKCPSLEDGGKPIDVPRIVKYRGEFEICDTLLFNSIDKPLDRIPTMVFNEIETALNKTNLSTARELDDKKDEITDMVVAGLETRFREIGLRLVLFRINSIERTRKEEQAEIDGRVVKTLAARTAEADDIESRGLVKAAKNYHEFTGGDPVKIAALQTALMGSDETEGISIMGGGATGENLPMPRGKKGRNGGRGAGSQPSRITPFSTILTDLMHDHTGHDGGN